MGGRNDCFFGRFAYEQRAYAIETARGEEVFLISRFASHRGLMLKKPRGGKNCLLITKICLTQRAYAKETARGEEVFLIENLPKNRA